MSMTDKNHPASDPDNERTRPSKPYRSDKDDETRPIRPPGDPENTILSSQRQGQNRPQPPRPQPRPEQRPPQRQPQQPPTRPGQQPLPYRYQSRRPVQPPPAYQQTLLSRQPPARPPRRWGRWLIRIAGLFSLLSLLAIFIALAGGVVTYFWFASQLPPAETLRSRSFQFATSQILDREGNLLWEIIDPTGGRRTTVTIDQVSPHLVNATIATEDRFFYLNVGVDPIAIARAVYYNLSEGEIVSGASTITQQLARNVLLTPEERTEQSFSRKIKEAVLAVEISRRYTKAQILEIYLNQIYYGNLAYGIEAAAQTYFGKRAAELTLAEASLLAGLPQSPAIHDPYVNPEGALARQADVLRLMVEADYIKPAEAEAAKFKNLDNLKELSSAFVAPHFVSYVRQELERVIPPEYIYQAGLRVQTTLDPRLQAIAEEEIRTQVDALSNLNVSNGALVALEVKSGQILAMVGSKDFRDEAIDGQVNMAISPRQPGSTIKPLTYLATFERLGWTPSTLLMDVPVEYPDGAGNVYRPMNYDNKFRGPVSMRIALANSLNIPAVKALEAVGVDALKEMAARLGITTLTRNDYGLALTLGSGETPLIEMTGAYQAMANQGVLIPPTAILQITDSFGRVIEPVRFQSRRTLREEHAYLMTHILADNEARSISVGPNSYLRLSRPAAVKTGTTNEFHDNWTIGYTPDIVAGVWIGNADRTPMNNVSGLSGAGPIWHNFMERAHEGLPVRDFVRPAAIIELEVCADSGTLPSPYCPERRKEIFFQEQPPPDPDHDIHQMIRLDRNTGLLANEYCQGNVEERYYRVYPADGRAWAIAQGIEQPPTDYCPSTKIIAVISRPLDGSTVRETTTLEGSALAANFSHYQIEFGLGTAPQAFMVIQPPVRQSVEEGILGRFDTSQVANGPYTLRLVVFDQTGGAISAEVRVLVDNPVITPTPSPTLTDQPTASPTDTLTPEPTATETPTSTPTPPVPTETPTLIPLTETPTSTPSATSDPAITPSLTPDVSLTVLPTITGTLVSEAITDPATP